MKATKLCLSLACVLALSQNGIAQTTRCEGSSCNQNTRLYDNKGEFKGRIIGSGDNVRIYDNNGQFKGRIIQDKDGNNTRIYDNKGNFQGRVIK